MASSGRIKAQEEIVPLMLTRRSPVRVAARALLLVSSLGLTSTGVFATGTGRSAPRPSPEPARPVAGLVPIPRHEAARRGRARIVARASQPAVSSYAAARPAALAVAATGDEQRAFELINAERRRRGLSPL